MEIDFIGMANNIEIMTSYILPTSLYSGSQFNHGLNIRRSPTYISYVALMYNMTDYFIKYNTLQYSDLETNYKLLIGDFPWH